MEMKVPMEGPTFQLLLRACKDCGVGEDVFTYDLLLACMTSAEARKHRLELEAGKAKELQPGEERRESEPSQEQEIQQRFVRLDLFCVLQWCSKL